VKRGLAAPAPPDVAPGRVIANTGLNAAMFLAGGYAYEAAAGSAPLGSITWSTLGGVAAFVVARLVVNYFFVFTVQSVRGSRPPLKRIPVETRNATAFDLALLPAAVVFSLLYARGMTWGLILAGASLVLASILLQRENRLDLVVKRYVSHAKSSKILANPYELLRAERRDISIVFADLRGTTGISQRLAPAEMLTLLNDFHGAMIDEVIRAEATVDKILGDGLMVLVGAPVREEHHAAKAVHLGIMMHRAYRGVRRGLEEKGLPDPGMGVGISSGEVVIGNVGSEMRLDYTAIGREVNVASKLCAAAADGEILVSGECRRRAEESRAAGHAPYLTDLSFEDGRSIDVPGLEEPLKSTRVIYA
jgi:class 3 adenylate cyclase